MDIIHLLPDFVANQIAAGEVIQRPASVIKELMENSVDAGANRIEVWITDAGKTSIQVVDNGKGMSETDARLAFERHATSKIREASDLFKLTTMGFRGEALASIAAVAQVELKTRTEEDEIGVWLTLNGAKITEQRPVACSVGAQFIVNNLFYNVPARRRFLKSDLTETKSVMQEFERVALAHPDKEFTFHRDNVQLLDLRQGSFKKRIVDLFGSSLDKNLLPLQVETSLVKIDGFVGTPESARTKGARQFFFVNGRYMRHPYFNRAIVSAFDKLIAPDKQVPYFIRFDVEPSRIDVNIHPTKTEIKFEDEQAIWQILLAVVKESLGSFNAVPTLDFEPSETPEIPIFNPKDSSTGKQPPKYQIDKKYNPFDALNSETQHINKTYWEELYKGLETSSILSQGTEGTQVPVEPLLYADASMKEKQEWESKNSVTYFHYDRYILMPASSGLMLIDQSRAHVRILYDRFMQQLEKKADGVSHGLLFPELFQLPASQAVVMRKIMDDFKAVGFDISSCGGNTYAVNGVPAGTEKQNAVDMVTTLLGKYSEKDAASEVVHTVIALTLAKANAIEPNQSLTQDEMSKLVEDLFSCSTPKYTPEGKSVLAILDKNKLEMLLK